jgi:hypothetical protein
VEGCSIQNPYDPPLDYSVAGFDLTNILSFAWVYPIPVGPGRQFSTHSKVFNLVQGASPFEANKERRSGSILLPS